ncbi:hypothetical protein MUK42_12434 [Musa troglodytarum]|uniref:Uncharacterized protein n=1 Tax=Musa troglodytarum TaxID=320322 RepID=A0A9E7I683_9LILI|nr:hypothetical protein MUK42_12434 [Musa troglodytarum]
MTAEIKNLYTDLRMLFVIITRSSTYAPPTPSKASKPVERISKPSRRNSRRQGVQKGKMKIITQVGKYMIAAIISFIPERSSTTNISGYWVRLATVKITRYTPGQPRGNREAPEGILIRVAQERAIHNRPPPLDPLLLVFLLSIHRRHHVRERHRPGAAAVVPGTLPAATASWRRTAPEAPVPFAIDAAVPIAVDGAGELEELG